MENSPLGSNNNNITDPKDNFGCPICKNIFGSTLLLYEHIKDCRKLKPIIICPKCSKGIYRKNMDHHVSLCSKSPQIEKESTSLCEICKQNLNYASHKWDCENHPTYMQKIGKVTCPICNDLYFANQLFDHMDTHSILKNLNSTLKNCIRAPDLFQIFCNFSDDKEIPQDEKKLILNSIVDQFISFGTCDDVLELFAKNPNTKNFDSFFELILQQNNDLLVPLFYESKTNENLLEYLKNNRSKYISASNVGEIYEKYSYLDWVVKECTEICQSFSDNVLVLVDVLLKQKIKQQTHEQLIKFCNSFSKKETINVSEPVFEFDSISSEDDDE